MNRSIGRFAVANGATAYVKLGQAILTVLNQHCSRLLPSKWATHQLGCCTRWMSRTSGFGISDRGRIVIYKPLHPIAAAFPMTAEL